jgi:hypothetical protein
VLTKPNPGPSHGVVAPHISGQILFTAGLSRWEVDRRRAAGTRAQQNRDTMILLESVSARS